MRASFGGKDEDDDDAVAAEGGAEAKEEEDEGRALTELQVLGVGGKVSGWASRSDCIEAYFE